MALRLFCCLIAECSTQRDVLSMGRSLMFEGVATTIASMVLNCNHGSDLQNYLKIQENMIVVSKITKFIVASPTQQQYYYYLP